MKDRLTGFDSSRFTAVAAGGALTIGAALTAGAINTARRNGDAWAGWTRCQLERAVNLLEVFNAQLRRELADEREENRRLRAVIRLRAGRDHRA